MSKRVEKIVLVGRDAAVWLAALALERAFGAGGVQISVVELPTRLHPTDVIPAMPAIAGLHGRLELEESALLRLTGGIPMVGQRYANWAGPATPFILGYDDPPPPGGDLEFAYYWLKAHQEGLKTPYEGFSLGATAARAGRVPARDMAQEAEISASYGYHLDARSYAGLLKHLTERRGVETRTSPSVSAILDGERIEAVVLEDGQKVQADLFVDVSGTEGILIREMPGAGFDSWRRWLPCDRVLTASGGPLSPLPAFSQISAFSGGWIGLYPLQGRTGVIATYSSSVISDDELSAQLPIITRLRIAGEATVAPFEAGVQARPWIGNCVAVGEAAISLEPLDALPLHLVHTCVSHLINVFPATAEEMPEATVFNRSIALAARNMRDFQIAHYRLNRRYDEPLWDAARDVALPESIDRKLSVFAARGLLFTYDQESFAETAWGSLFLGHGLAPEDYDPRVDLMPEQEHILHVQRRLQRIAELVGTMPRVEEVLAEAAQPIAQKVAPGA